LLCAALSAALPAAAGSGLLVSAEVSGVPQPRSYATCGYRLENETDQPRSVHLSLESPTGWTPVVKDRVLLLLPHAAETILFTIWVPADASADSLYTLRLKTRSEGPEAPESVCPREVRVAARSALTLTSLTGERTVRAGERVQHLLHLKNDGNRTEGFAWKAASCPGWKTQPEKGSVRLAPGETASIEISVLVPHTALPGTAHLLTVSAEGEDRVEGTAAAKISRQIESTVVLGVTVPSRFLTIPLEAAVTAGEFVRGQPSYGLRLATEGPLIPGAQVDVDLDLVTGQRSPGVEAWRNQHARLGMSRGPWNAVMGDVALQFPELAASTVSVWGLSLENRRDLWGFRFLLGRNRTAGSTSSWGLGADGPVTSKITAGGDLLFREEDYGRLGVKRSQLLCADGKMGTTKQVQLHLNTAWSRSLLQGERMSGLAGQLALDHLGDRWQARGRLYTASADFAGRNQDRDGLASYVMYAPRLHTRLWSSLDVSRGRLWALHDAPQSQTARYRLGGRWTAPAGPTLEATVGALSERGSEDAGVRDMDQQDLNLTATRSFGQVLAVASGSYGRGKNLETGRSGPMRGLELSLAGPLGDLRGALDWKREYEWQPEASASLWSTILTGDFSWVSNEARLQAGMGISYHQVHSLDGNNVRSEEIQWQPRVDYRLAPRVALRVDASLLRRDGRAEVDRWQIQLSYAASDIVPVPWRPTRGGVRGLVFLDADLDGEADPSERRIGGVLVTLDGKHVVTDQAGTFEYPAMPPGTYWCDLNRGSLPAGLVPQGSLPLEVRLEAGDEQSILIPLVPSADISGFIFLDQNHDGVRSSGEEGLSEMRMILLQDGRKVAEGLSDATGRYHIPEVPPGRYSLKVAEGWLPAGWVVTTAQELHIEVVAGSRLLVAPFGLAPRQKPIIRTFQGQLK
jgi:hypothetical protein